MEAAAIEKIEGLSSAANRDLSKHTDYPAVVVPGSAEVIGLEQYQERPNRQRAKFHTERIADFVRYVKAEHRDDETAVFVNPDGERATAVIDYGTHENPRWKEHRAFLEMQQTPEYRALNQIVGKPVSQRDLIDFIEDWRQFIEPYTLDEDTEEREPVTVARALAMTRRIDLKGIMETAHEERDFKNTRSSLASIEANSDGQKLPAGFYFECKPYMEVESRQIDVRLSVRTGGDKPALVARIVGQGALQSDIAEEVEFDITSRLEGVRVFVGII